MYPKQQLQLRFTATAPIIPTTCSGSGNATNTSELGVTVVGVVSVQVVPNATTVIPALNLSISVAFKGRAAVQVRTVGKHTWQD